MVSYDVDFDNGTDYRVPHRALRIADSIDQYDGFLKGKTIVMFFPASSIRTRVSFELWLRISNPERVRVCESFSVNKIS